MRIRSTNLGSLEPTSASRAGVTGHRKRPEPWIDVIDPGVRLGLSGVEGDAIGDRRYHGGTDQAVYAFAREDLDRWESELGVRLPDGSFGENLTTEGYDVNAAVLGERWRVGAAELVVTHPRLPCRTFAGVIDQPRWVKRFTAVGRPGPYLRVALPGRIAPGDPLVVLDRPAHGVTLAQLFAALTTDRALVPHCLSADADLTDYARTELLKRA